jgi:glycosyltransferase involved in cell wall biosynthesis
MEITSHLSQISVPRFVDYGRIAVIMPVYNEADTIESTITELYDKVASKLPFVDIWVFEDGSNDGTKEVLSKMAKRFANFYVQMSPDKKGYPKAMKDAFLNISPEKYYYVVAIDSDGQYEPNDFYKIFQAMDDTIADVVMGRRMSRKEPMYRRFLSKGLQLLEKMMFPVKCKDVTSVMRLMRVETGQDIAREVAYSPYNFWLEFTARMSLKKLKIVEIPINYRERVGGSKVYSVTRMPKVILSEYNALRSVKKEYALKAAVRL